MKIVRAAFKYRFKLLDVKNLICVKKLIFSKYFTQIIIHASHDHSVSLCMDNMTHFSEIEKLKELFMLYNLYDGWVILVRRVTSAYSRILNI